MIRLQLLFWLFLTISHPFIQAQTDPCDPPIAAALAASGPVCAGETVTLTFTLPDDDDGEGFDITYSIGSTIFTLTAVGNGHTATHFVTTTTNATLIQVVNNGDDDDDDDCFTNFNQTILVTVSNPQASISSQTNPACGQQNGSITAAAANGAPPYQFSLNGGPFQNSAIFTGLAAGNYDIAVRDAAGCTDNTTTTLASPGSPVLSIAGQTNPACGQQNGSITAAAANGTQPYQFSLNGGPFQNSPIFTGLPAGNYDLNVQDAAGCIANTNTTLNSPGSPTLSIAGQTNPACGQQNGSITAAVANGAPPYQFSLNGGPFQNTPIFTGLAAGNYNIAVRDAAGCQSTLSAILINAGINFPLATIQSNTKTGCTNTVFTLTGNLPPGTTGVWTCAAFPPPTPNNPVWTLQSPPPGIVAITWTLSAPTCPNYDTATILLNILPPPQANMDGLIQVLSDEEAEVKLLDNDIFASPVTVRIIRGPTQGTATLNNNQTIDYKPFIGATGLDTVAYEICYDLCSANCDTALILFQINQNNDPCVLPSDTFNVFTNGLTPNGDRRNDVLVFRVVSVEDCEVNHAKSEIIVYNRWGDVVFEASPYNNDWGGTNNNDKELPPGVYYFVLRITLERTYTQFGSVILIR